MPSGTGWSKSSPSLINRNRKRCLQPARSSSAWQKAAMRYERSSEGTRTQFESAPGFVSRFFLARLASATASQLQTLLFWAEHLGNRHLDDAAGNKLAGLSSNPFGAAAGHC